MGTAQRSRATELPSLAYGTAQPGYGTAQPGYGTAQPGYTQPTGTTPAGTAPAATTTATANNPFGQLTGMVGAVLGQMGGAATGGTTGGTTGASADPITLGIQHNASQNAPGMQPLGTMVRLTLQQGQTSEGQFQLEPGK